MVIDLDDPGVGVAPLALDQRGAIVGRQVDDGIRTHGRRVGGDLRGAVAARANSTAPVIRLRKMTRVMRLTAP